MNSGSQELLRCRKDLTEDWDSPNSSWVRGFNLFNQRNKLKDMKQGGEYHGKWISLTSFKGKFMNANFNTHVHMSFASYKEFSATQIHLTEHKISPKQHTW